jgi:hypothetical protein
MRYANLALLIALLPCSCFAGWELSTSTSNNIGALIASTTEDHESFLVNTNGDNYLLLSFYSGGGNLLSVNLTAQTATLAHYPNARMGVRGTAYTNGVYYFALPNSTYNEGSYKGQLYSYEVSSGTTNRLALTSIHGGYHMEIGDDGWIYLGSQVYANLERYNPTTGVLEDYGKADPDHTDGNVTVYSIGADERYVYCQIYNGWYLAVIDNQTGERTNFFYGVGDVGSGVNIFRGRTGGWYYERQGVATGMARVWYALSNGVPNLIGTDATFRTNVYYSTDFYRAGVVDPAGSATNETGRAFDLGYIYPNSSNNWATVRWKGNAESEWQQASATNFTLSAANPKKLYSDGGEIFVLGPSYGPMLRYAPASGVVTIYGTSPYSLIGAVKNGGDWCIAGYDAATLIFNPTAPWTLSPSTLDITSPSVNPHKLGLSLRTHEFDPCIGSDGLLYVASHVDRNGSGGYLGWQDLAGTSGYYRPTTWEYASNSVSGLTPFLGATKLAYTPSGWPALYVFNVATKTMERTNAAILPAATTLGKCVEVASGVLVGVNGGEVWRYDYASESTITNALPGTAWPGFTYKWDKVLCLGPDGYVWLTLGNDLYRLHPTTCEPELIKAGVGPHNVMFNGGDAYLYNPSTPELHVLSGLLTYTAPPAQPSGTLRANKLVVR